MERDYNIELIRRARELINIISEKKPIPKEHKNMLSITAFVQKKEIVLPKDEDDNQKKHLYFDYEKYKDYIPFMKNILTIANDGFDKTNDDTTIHIINGPQHDQKLNDSLLLISRIRDSIRHGNYEINDDNNTLIINAVQNNYSLNCIIPLSFLDLFSTCGSSMISMANGLYLYDEKTGIAVSKEEQKNLFDNQHWRLLFEIKNNIYKDYNPELNESLLMAAIYNYMFISLSNRDKNEDITNFEYFPFHNIIFEYYDKKNRVLLDSLMGKAFESFIYNYNEIDSFDLNTSNLERRLLDKLEFLVLTLPKHLKMRNEIFLESLSNSISHFQITPTKDGMIIIEDTKAHSREAESTSNFMMITRPKDLINLLDVINKGTVDVDNLAIEEILKELNSVFNSLIINRQIQTIAQETNMDDVNVRFLDERLTTINHLERDISIDSFSLKLDELFKSLYGDEFDFKSKTISDLHNRESFLQPNEEESRTNSLGH